MSGKNAQCSEITLPEFGGLFINLTQLLMGKRGRFWLNALKRLCRKENPWIPFRKIMYVNPCGRMLDHIKVYLDEMKELGINVPESMYSIPDNKVIHLLRNLNIPKHHIVLVKLGDLLTLEERTSGNYQTLLDKAAESGFEPCDIREGFAAALVLVKEAKSAKRTPEYTDYFICTEPMKTGEDILERIPNIAIKTGDRSPENDNQGLMTMFAVNFCTNDTAQIDSMENPETLLLFRSIPW